MSRLTEEMVIARAKQSDLSSIKKLNCWGSDLSDVSIIKRMRGVEVLALSVNKISTLQPFEDCLKLQELYLRKNNIQNINEIAYLQNLPNLKYLWLEENPCCDRAGPNYRSLVLRSLPNLKKLDNVEVTPEELEAALKGNVSVGGGVADEEPYEDAYDNQQQQQNEVQQHPNQRQHQQQQQPPNQAHHHHHQSHYQTRRSSSPLKEVKEPQLQQSSPATTDDSVSETNNINNSSKASTPSQRSPDTDQESPRGGDGNGSGGNRYRERVPIPPSASTHSMKEYYQMDRPPYPAHYRHSQTDLTEWEEQQTHPHLNHNPYGSTATLHHTPANRRSAGNERVEPTDRYSYRNGGRDAADWDEDRTRPRRPDGRYADASCTVSTAVLNHYANFHRRPINRSSNLLSATLCLVKELDYSSLEVVEHAVRCRLDELSAE